MNRTIVFFVAVRNFRERIPLALQSAANRRIGSLLSLIVFLLPLTSLSQGTTTQDMHQKDLRANPTLELSLKQAVELALAPEGNAKVQLAEELIRQAEARSAQSRAVLLPNVDTSVSQQSRTVNLAAFGIQIETPIPGFRVPEFVGPFNTFDVRATLTQTVFDWSSIRRFQASRANVRSSKTDKESIRDGVAGQVATAYLAGLRAEATVEAAKANVSLAESLLQLAVNQKSAGTGTGIEITRAQVQLANERREAYLQLLRTIGLGMDGALQLTDKLARRSTDTPEMEQALSIAWDSRADFKAQQQREESARLNYSATKWERLPSLVGFGDYGSIGSSINNAIPTRTYGVVVKLPVFDGGRLDARRAESYAQLQQETIKTRDLRDQIELEVRVALDRVISAEQRVKVADEGLDLAQGEMAQAQRRYQSGVTSSLEVTDAQTRLERARDNQIGALFSYNLARIDLAQAMGTVRRLIQ